MYSTSDTIVAIATPSGRGAIGVVRISGGESERIARDLTRRTSPFEPRRATTCLLSAALPAAPQVNDQVVLTFFKAPSSYTGEDVVEISAHGSPMVLAAIVIARAVIEHFETFFG